MIVQDFKGYIESPDISKIPIDFLTKPSKNVLVNKGKVVTRGGIENDGVAVTAQEAVHSEFVWTDAIGGTRPLRVHGNTLQVKYNSKWYNLYTGIDADTTRVIFATWVDKNGSIVKKRVFFSDGSSNLHQWNGGIAEVASYASDVITIDGSKTLAKEGFDVGNTPVITLDDATTQFDITDEGGGTFRYTYDGTGTDPAITATTHPTGSTVIIADTGFASANEGTFILTGSGANYFEVANASGTAESNKTIGASGSIIKVETQGVRVFSLDGDGDVDSTDDYEYANDPLSGQDITLTTTPSPVPVAGDIVMQKPTKVDDVISADYDIDAIYSFQNHIAVASYNSVYVYFSHIETFSLETGLDFTIPASGSRTAITPILLVLDEHFTAMIARKNPVSTTTNVLWVSSKNDWYKITKTVDQNQYDQWVDAQKFGAGELKGALPMACASYKGDIVYLAQDSTLQRIQTVEAVGLDQIALISDDVQALLDRLDTTDVRLYYVDRAIYIIFPQDNTLVMLDMVEGHFQPPQTMPINCMSVIDGVKYGHHSVDNQTYILFTGRNDLGTLIEAKVATGLHHGDHQFRYKQHTIFGASVRLTTSTKADVASLFEETGAKGETSFEIDGSKVKTYAIDDDVSWATHPYAERSLAGADMEVQEVKRAMVFDKRNALSYFDFRTIITITGDDNEFHLLGIYIDEKPSNIKIGNDLFVAKT